MSFEAIRQKAVLEWQNIENGSLPKIYATDSGAEETEPVLNVISATRNERVLLKHCGCIDPENIAHYIANEGYSGFNKALGMKLETVIQEIEQAGLRGRGGAGFPTAAKWRACREKSEQEKYIVCNAAETDTQSRIIGQLLESNPHSVLEGILIAAYAVGANQGYVCSNGKRTLAMKRLATAVRQMKEYCLLGNNILGSDFSFDIEIIETADSIVAGEETVLLSTIEGKRRITKVRPPYPAVTGLFGKPTVVNNAETLATVSMIIQNGAAWYSGFGTEKSKGTKLVTLSGCRGQYDVIEVPMGTSLRQIVDDFSAGTAVGDNIKAVLVGGITGGLLANDKLDIPFDFDSLRENSAIMGAGSIAVYDQTSCMVELVKNCLAVAKRESCGKCILCRGGTIQMHQIITDITEGKGQSDDLELLTELAENMKIGASCNFGKSVANLVLTALHNFFEEYEKHIKRNRCDALICKKFVSYHILGETCQGCSACLVGCPSNAIQGGENLIHVIDQDKCIKCGSCFEVCTSRHKAVTKASGVKPNTPKEPIPVGTWKKKGLLARKR